MDDSKLNKTKTAMFDRDSLYKYVWRTLRDEIGDNTKTDYLTDRICNAVSEWVPKKGTFWLNEDDGRLYVNKGWEDILSNETYDDPFLATLTPEQREWRLKKIATTEDSSEILENDCEDLGGKWDDPIPPGVDPWNLRGRQ